MGSSDGYEFTKLGQMLHKTLMGATSARTVAEFGIEYADDYVNLVFDKINNTEFIKSALRKFIEKRKSDYFENGISIIEFIDYLFKQGALATYGVGLESFNIENADTEENVKKHMHKILMNNEYGLEDSVQSGKLYDYIASKQWQICATLFSNFEKMMLHKYGSELGAALRVIDPNQKDEEDNK